MDILITHVSVVTMDENLTVLTDAFLGVKDGKIAYLAKTAPDGAEKPKKIIDGTGMVVMPGLINCHTHLPMSILRSVSDDCNLNDWLHGLWEKEARLDDRAVKASTLLGIMECLRFGVTSVSDM
ncbi:MAG: amidohydrolase family protein, partial [Oscillospiraceae bacterium]|nr:amidohydrolase family protein [Oscillospiraceae bacterium]